MSEPTVTSPVRRPWHRATAWVLIVAGIASAAGVLAATVRSGTFPTGAAAALALVLGTAWAFLLRLRARSDVARAYDALVREVNERRAAEECLRASEARFRLIVQQTSDLTAITDADGKFLYSSPAGEQACGAAPNGLIGRSIFDTMPPEDRPLAMRKLAEAVEHPSTVVQLEVRAVSPDGGERVIEAVLRSQLDHPDVAGVVWNGRDITERRLLSDQLAHQAYHDGLTGLPNRSLFLRKLAEGVAGEHGMTGSVSAVLIDLDGFKNVNDTLGHAAGDELLRQVADRLLGCVRTGDTVARLGGDEFAIVLPDQRPEQVLAIAERVVGVLEPPVRIAGQDVSVGASVGVAHRERHQAAEDLLCDADIAMYQAKRAGKGRVAVFDRTMGDRAAERTRLEQQLSKAITAGEIEVHYQPIAHLGTNRVVALEALARWHQPERGMVSPALFVPVAEETGQIIELGRQVLREACRTVQGWRTTVPGAHAVSVAVNVSGRQIVSGRLFDQVAEALAESRLPPDALTLEITESMLLEDSPEVVAELVRIKALGVRLALDDFGAGYSSLASLQRFNVDILKIDKTFLDFDTSAHGSLVQAVAEMGRTLGLVVVAEGVETAAQLARVRAAECDAAQGFYLSRPLAAGDTRFFLERAGTTDEVAVLLAPVP